MVKCRYPLVFSPDPAGKRELQERGIHGKIRNRSSDRPVAPSLL